MKLIDENVLITGGTGSFGNYITNYLLTQTKTNITIFSRDEFKQYEMRKKYEDNPRLKFVIGDVRNHGRINEAVKDIDVVFHAAALKQVPSCENNPFEAVQTNVLGAKNVADAAIANGVKRVVAISTDKAVKPVNVMGMTKALQERIMLDANHSSKTVFNVVRYGNIIGSRGSVIPLFVEAIRANKPIPITNPSMTRFWLTLDNAIDLVLYAATALEKECIFVKKAPASSIVETEESVCRLLDKLPVPVKVVGSRKGEKLHEVLVSETEMINAKETKDYFIIKPFQEKSAFNNSIGREYTSENTRRLKEDELDALLKSIIGGF